MPDRPAHSLALPRGFTGWHGNTTKRPRCRRSENLVVDVDALDVGASEPTAPWFDATPDDTPNAFAAAAAVGVVERKAGVSAASLDPATSLDGGVRGVTEVDEVLSALDGEGGGEKQGDATHQAYLDRTAAEAAAAVPKGGSGGGGNATGRSAVVLAAYKEDYAWGGGCTSWESSTGGEAGGGGGGGG